MDGVDDQEEEEIIGVDVAVAGSTDSAVFKGSSSEEDTRQWLISSFGAFVTHEVVVIVRSFVCC